jgi:hypothetical protein
MDTPETRIWVEGGPKTGVTSQMILVFTLTPSKYLHQ